MKPRAYAFGTTVAVEKSRAEIEKLLANHGAAQLGIISDAEQGVAFVLFTIDRRQVRLRVPLPRLNEVKSSAKNGHIRTDPTMRWEQLTRERWRAVLLLVRAKLELVELGISTIEREFLADIALPDGQTVGEALHPRLEEAYETGRMPPLLPGGPS